MYIKLFILFNEISGRQLPSYLKEGEKKLNVHLNSVTRSFLFNQLYKQKLI